MHFVMQLYVTVVTMKPYCAPGLKKSMVVKGGKRHPV